RGPVRQPALNRCRGGLARIADQPLVRSNKLHAAGGRITKLLQVIETQRERRGTGQQRQHDRQRNSELYQRGPFLALRVRTAFQASNGQKSPPGLASTNLHESSSARRRSRKLAAS